MHIGDGGIERCFGLLEGLFIEGVKLAWQKVIGKITINHIACSEPRMKTDIASIACLATIIAQHASFLLRE